MQGCQSLLGQSLLGTGSILVIAGMTLPAAAEQPLTIAYPPPNHETTAARIFLIGTASPSGQVLVNGTPIARHGAGHFAPSFPLTVGKNSFVVSYEGQTITVVVNRLATTPIVPSTLAFGDGSLTPAVSLARLPGEVICFGAVAPPTGRVTVHIGDRRLSLEPQSPSLALPPNSAVLTRQNQPTASVNDGKFQGCTVFDKPGALGRPQFTLVWQGKTLTQSAPGEVTILSPQSFSLVTVTAESGAARTGPSTDYSRLTPLPKGTQALMTGQEGDWLRLDYGAWIHRREVAVSPTATPPGTIIRSLRTEERPGWTDIRFPLQVPVPIAIEQGDHVLTLTLYNTTAQTDTIYTAQSSLLDRLDWQQSTPDQVRYRLNLKTAQQWGYEVYYDGTTLVLSLRHPPAITPQPGQPLQGLTVLLDPGHGGDEDFGSRGPTGYPEKAATLTISKLLQTELTRRGARVRLTRDRDVDLGLADRVAMINQDKPTIALSLHYNALPDDGDALGTQGVATFWYNPQAYSLAMFLQTYLVTHLHRPSDGVFWNNLALTRPTLAPSVLLELGYMINPDEYEWIMDPQSQQQLAVALADGIVAWVESRR